MKLRSVVGYSAFTLIVAGGAIVLASRRTSGPSGNKGNLSASRDEVPLASVQRGDVEMNVYATGELRASHAMMLTAPSVGGGSLEITQLLPTSSPVKKGDIVIAFDPSEQQYKLDQSRSELMQAEQEITKANADAAVLAAQDKVAMLKARYDVRQAELDVQKNEIVSSIDAKKNQLALQQAQRIQAELEQDSQSHKESGQAAIYLAKEKYNKAKLAMDQAQESIDKMRVAAPMDGLVALEKNENATGGFFFGGMSLPEYHEGDQVEAGRTVGQVIDPKEMELSAKVGELERNNIKEGQPVDMKLDALPGNTFQGKVKIVGGASNRMPWDDDATARFEIAIKLSTTDPRLRPGMTARIFINGEPRKSVIYVPRQALFLKENKRVVFVRNGNTFDPREVKIQAENESRAAIEGIRAGTEVALIDPTAPRKAANSSAPSAAGGGGAP